LHNGDIEELLHAGKGKSRDDELSDANLAIVTYQNVLQERSTILTDDCMARSLTQATISDAALLRESLVEENAAIEDQALALRFGGIHARLLQQNKGQQAIHWTTGFWQDWK
jgi:hypothetical protein